MLSQQIL